MAMTGLKPVCHATAPSPSSRQHFCASVVWYRYTSRGLPWCVPSTHVPTIARPIIRSPTCAGSGVIAASTSRGATSTPLTRTLSVRSMPSAWMVLSLSMKSEPSAYLKLAFLSWRPPGSQRGSIVTSSCSTLTHSTSPTPSGKGNISGALKGGVVCHSPSSQTIGGLRHSSIVVQMLNTGANGEAGDLEVTPVTDVDLLDAALIEEMLDRVRGEDIA